MPALPCACASGAEAAPPAFADGVLAREEIGAFGSTRRIAIGDGLDGRCWRKSGTVEEDDPRPG